ncbi:MAG: hypothetical protein JSV37_13615 [Anaerolineaceae bacterium]|nr:MAG: hypothetical protein JSV37_13615 [Anaerolineaceae bacterium]
MLIIFPVLAFVGIFLSLGNLDSENGSERAFFRASILWGTYLILMTEGLSLLEGITPWGLTLGWLLPLLVTGGFFVFRVKAKLPIVFPKVHFPKGRWDRLLMLAVLVVIGLTALLAWLSPPQTWDSLTYHMARVAHWAQQRAVRHYVTGIGYQNSMPPGSEIAMLHVYVLFGGDRLTTFVQWFAMLGCLVGVFFIARRLGVGPAGRMIAVIFVATLPMGIVQASSTVSDYVVAFWMVCVAYESVMILKGKITLRSVVYVSLAAGVGLVTKPTAVAYVLPFAFLVAIIVFRQIPIIRSLRYIAVSFILVLMLNAGYLLRNTALYGNPIASEKRISVLVNETMSAQVVLSNSLRNMTLHAGTPSPYINKAIYLVVAQVHELIGLDVDDPRITAITNYKVSKPTTNEDKTSNPLHALLILIVFFVLLIRRKEIEPEVIVLSLVVTVTFPTFSSLIKWMVFNTRLHLPFFVLYAPIVGYSLDRFLKPSGVRTLAAILLFASWPWLMSIHSRPLITNSKSFVDSVLVTPREDLYFANGWHLREPYLEMAEVIKESGCSSIGILLPGNGAEYPLWALLGAPRNAPRIEWIDAGITSKYTDPDFVPCAVICQVCSEDETYFNELPRRYKHHATKFQLFLDVQGSTSLP